jgi:general secretion pathway protein D
MRPIRSVACLLAVALAAQEPLGWQAEKAEKEGNLVRAWVLYSQASAMEPKNKKYAAKAASLRDIALERAQVLVTNGRVAEVEIDPSIVRPITEDELAEIRRLRMPPLLQPKPGKLRFRSVGPVRTVAEQVLRTCGIDAVFDSAFDATQQVKFDLENIACADAIPALELVGGIFLVPIAETVAMVVRDTADRRREQDPVAAISIPLPEPVSVQEAQEAARSVQQALEIQKFAVDSARRVALIRDRVWKVRQAELIFLQLMTRRAEVYIDVDLVQYAKQRDSRWGLGLQAMTQLVNFGGLWNVETSIPSGFNAFLTFGGGLTLFGIGITTANIFASMTDTQGTVVQSATIRCLDSLPGELLFGQRYPIQVQVYIGEGAGSPDAFAPPPQIQFENLGLTLKITPRVHYGREVTLGVESDFKTLTGEELNGIPVIATRTYQGQVRLKEGEWAVAAGLTNFTDTRGINGIAGISEIPGVGAAFRDNTRSRGERDYLLLLKPRIVHTGPLETVTPPIWVGSETRPLPPI